MARKFKLEIEEGICEEIFEVLQELINRAKANHDDVVLCYVVPLLQAFGESLIKEKKKYCEPDRYTLPRLKKHRSLN